MSAAVPAAPDLDAPLDAPLEAPLASAAARLDAAIHDGDPRRLAEAHRAAADTLEALGDQNAACFQLVHAHVHALETGDPNLINPLRARLVALGREA